MPTGTIHPSVSTVSAVPPLPRATRAGPLLPSCVQGAQQRVAHVILGRVNEQLDGRLGALTTVAVYDVRLVHISPLPDLPAAGSN